MHGTKDSHAPINTANVAVELPDSEPEEENNNDHVSDGALRWDGHVAVLFDH